ncbi:T-cell surface glycoprotein CD3 epsilon chain-like protein [Cricetulus griseus]|uniref:T-cell surface glycoprotein CD3 epsilon chain n=1 Tax=Cricetulus griseus TaxID=10029 RepID=A0A061I1M1_CRIGR|nr:T-cell surface glycoprotein CD3 epsilon chain-like protein [Cricetulus griseus]
MFNQKEHSVYQETLLPRLSCGFPPTPFTLPKVGTWQDDTENPDNEAQKDYTVSISGTRIELTCPVDGEINWEKNDKVLSEENDKLLVLENFSEVEDSGYYACYLKDSPKNTYLYLKARVCENCVEVDLTAVAIIIVVDICITLGLLMVVYYWSKNRKAKAKPVTRGTGAGGRPRGERNPEPKQAVLSQLKPTDSLLSSSALRHIPATSGPLVT